MGNTETTERILLKSAKIYDGSGKAPFQGNILISGDRILEVTDKAGYGSFLKKFIKIYHVTWQYWPDIVRPGHLPAAA